MAFLCSTQLKIQISGDLQGSIRSVYDAARTQGNLDVLQSSTLLQSFPADKREGVYKAYVDCVVTLVRMFTEKPVSPQWKRWVGVWSGHIAWQNPSTNCWGTLLHIRVHEGGTFDGDFGSNEVTGQINAQGRIMKAAPNSGTRPWGPNDFAGNLQSGTILSRACGGSGSYKLSRIE